MRVYYKNSLFLYSVGEGDPTPIINFWRATVFTFGHEANKKTLKKAIKEVVGDAADELIETGIDPYDPGKQTEAFETRQVEHTVSRGLGFNAVEVSFGWKHRRQLHPEQRMEVFQLQVFEAADARLGLSDAGRFFAYAKKHYRRPWREALERGAKLLWRWFTS